MIHLVTLEAPPVHFANLVGQLRNLSNGFYVLSAGHYLVVTNNSATELRDWLRLIGASRVAVLRLQGGWGTTANQELAQWLQNAASFF